MRTVEVVPHNPQWHAAFEVEAKRVAAALAANVVAIHHIGSTSIPKIYAKPIIDMLVEVKDITHVDRCDAAMVGLGYEAMGEFGIVGRRYFRKHNEAGTRTHHVHIFAHSSKEAIRHLAFRNYLTAHPEAAQSYSQLKRELAQQHPTDIDSYMDGKDKFIKAIDRKAASWRADQHLR